MWLHLILMSLPFSAGHGPLNPRCVGALVIGPEQDAPTSVTLHDCNADQVGVEVEGAQVTWSDPQTREFTRYEVVGKLPNGDWAIHWVWNGGGSGNFSGLGVFRLSATSLRRIRIVTEGDRCNGGVRSASIAGSKLKFSASVTPADVLQASTFGKSLALNAEGLLERSAASCVATLELTETVLTGVTLDAALEDRPGWTEGYRLQHCYNALQNEVAAKTPHLDLAGLEGFARQFKTRCLEAADAGR
jgi:hypothetical protein